MFDEELSTPLLSEVKQEEIAEIGAANKDQIEAPKEKTTDTTEGEKVQVEYQEQLKRYYDSIDQQQKAYQSNIQQYQPTNTNLTNPDTGPSNAETGTINSGVTSPTTTDVSSPMNTETASSNVASPYPGYSNASPLNPQVVPGYQPYGSQPYPPYGPYNNPDNSSSSSSSSSSGSKSSTSSTSSSDSSSSTSITVGLSPLNSTNQTEPGSNISVSDASSLPSKVAPETPSLPALPPLLVLPPISESLLVEEPSKTNSTTSVDKEPNDKQKTALQQVADSRPYPPDRGSSTKNEGAKIKHKTQQKAESDRKIITEDQQTNEMTKSESKHLAVIVHGHNLEDEDNEEDEPKIIKAFSDEPGKLQLKGYIKKKNMDLDLKEAKQKFATKHERTKPSENEDAVFKHDEKSVSVSGSGAGGMEESFEDLNYITDFNPDDFDMDVPDLSHKDLTYPNDKRNPVEFLEDHPLFSRSGIQKARSEITAPTIIDATEHGAGETTEGVLNDAKDHIRSKIHTRSKTSSKTVPKAEIKEANKEEASSGTAESNEEDNSGMPSEEKSNYKVTFDGDEEKYGDKGNTAEKNSIVKKDTKKYIATKKGKKAEKKSTTATTTTTTLTKGKTTANKKSKVLSTKTKIDGKKNDKDKKDKQVAKEKSEVSELMSEKGDTAAVRNKKAEKKSSTTLIKKSHKHEGKSIVSTRKEIPKIKEEVLSSFRFSYFSLILLDTILILCTSWYG